MKRFKYIHILWSDETKFTGPLVHKFNDSSLGLPLNESLFVARDQRVFNELKDYSNVVYDGEKCNVFNKYGPRCRWIFSHGYPKTWEYLFVRPNNKKKVVWRYWGGRRIPKATDTKNHIKNKINAIYNTSYRLGFKWKFMNVALIGVANYADKVDLSPLLPGIPMMEMPYGYKSDSSELYDEALRYGREYKQRKTDSKKRVVLGHHSTPLEEHIQWLSLLKDYPEDKIDIFIPMSYPLTEEAIKYRESVENYISRLPNKNIILIKEFIDYREYAKLMATMDAAIMPCRNSMGMGNISLQLNCEVPIYLHSDGLLSRVFDEKSIPYRSLEELEKRGFDFLSENFTYSREQIDFFKPLTASDFTEKWMKIFAFLDKVDSDAC